MFVYMSKKIAIPKHSHVSCLAWNQQSGYIAVGGDDGMLKVLKLESGGGGNLSMNLSLEGHTGQLQVATWNETHQKLTTSDHNGVIIVWMLYKGAWYEEMINNRNKSTVSGMAWSSDGQKICIAYEDGAVIVGSVDGSRVWGKDIKGPGLCGVQWSPDNSLLLFALANGELHLYDSQGNFAMSIMVQCVSLPMRVVSMDWYSGHITTDIPSLAICYQNGCIQLMKRHTDDEVVVIDCGMSAISCHWNHNGSAIAVAGKTIDDTNAVQFFTPYGEHLRTLRVPGGNLRACVWEGRSLRVAIAVDSFIYFANVKPDYRRAYFGTTLAYASNPHSVTFWDTVSNQSWINNIPNVVDMCGVGEYCVVATPHSLVVCNQQGIQCDAKITPMEICYVCMNIKNTVIAASRDCFMIWRFATPSKPASKEQIFYSDGTPCLGEFQTSSDPICCVACSQSLLLIGKESGDVLSYSLPDLTSDRTYKVGVRPFKLGINCNSTEFSVIDTGGCLHLMPVGQGGGGGEGGGRREVRKDVWGALWAEDNPRLLAVVERARLYVLKGGEPQEPLPINGYLCHFQDLEIVCANLCELGERGDTEHLDRLEVKALRDTRQLLDKVGLKEAEAFIKDNPHPKLWRLLAEAALRKLDLLTAETAYVHCSDYPGIQLVRRLSALRGTALRSAEVLACFKQFDEAEKIYLQEDRRDLAIVLRQRLGHWFRVVELLKMSTNTTEEQLREAYKNIGDYYWDRQIWTSAREYYSLASYQEGVVKCHVILEDHQALASMNANTPRKPPSPKAVAPPPLEAPSLATAQRLRDSGQLCDAASLLCRLADQDTTADRVSHVKMKKLYVLAGLLYQEAGDTSSSTQAFQKAGSWHWLSLAQGGSLPAALRLSARRPPPPKAPPALAALALNAASAKAFSTCSEAFVQLEALPEGSEEYGSLAIEIFTKHPPVDPKSNRTECTSCHTKISEWATSCVNCNSEFPGCALKGTPIHDPHSVWTCKQCHFTVSQHEIVLRQSCPVCHHTTK